jgi:hypothetical protein
MPGYYWCPKCHHAYLEQRWAQNRANCLTKDCDRNFNNAKDFSWSHVLTMRQSRPDLPRYPDIPDEEKEYPMFD